MARVRACIFESVESRRLLTTTFDTTFDGDGKLDPAVIIGQTTMTLRPASVLDVLALSNGKSIVVGEGEHNGAITGFIARLNANGTLDTTFGTNGVSYPPAYMYNGFAYPSYNQVRADGSGRLYVVANGFLGRYTSAGQLDTTYGNAPVIAGQIGGPGFATVGVNDIDVDTAGNVYSGWNTLVGSPLIDGQYMLRVLSTGLVDTAYIANPGMTAKKLTTPSFSAYPGTSHIDVALTPRYVNGKILGMGYVRYNFAVPQGADAAWESNTVIVRWNLDGSLDTTFGTQGIIEKNLQLNTATNSTNESAALATVLADGRLRVAIYTDNAPNFSNPGQTYIAGFTASGKADTAFGSTIRDGVFGISTSLKIIGDLDLAPSNRVLVMGSLAPRTTETDVRGMVIDETGKIGAADTFVLGSGLESRASIASNGRIIATTGSRTTNSTFSQFLAATLGQLTTTPNTTLTKPAAPTNLAGTYNGKVNLTWKDNATNETNYIVQRRQSGATTWTTLATLAANTSAYTDASTVANTTYDYQVLAKNTAGSVASNVISLKTVVITVTAPKAPTNVKSTIQTSPFGVKVTWTDNATNETSYIVQRRYAGVTTWTTLGTIAANSSSYIDKTALRNVTYEYIVVAVNSGGKGTSATLKVVTPK